MPLIPYKGIMPRVAEDVFIAEGAMVIGDVTIGSGSSIWYNTVIRADRAPITIGRNCNVQDQTIVHVDLRMPTVIGDNVSIGHGAVVHGCTVEDGVLVAIHATILTGAAIGAGSIVAAGAVVGEKKVIPPRSLVVGVPARVVRELTDAELVRTARTARDHVLLAREHRASAGVPGGSGTGDRAPAGGGRGSGAAGPAPVAETEAPVLGSREPESALRAEGV